MKVEECEAIEEIVDCEDELKVPDIVSQQSHMFVCNRFVCQTQKLFVISGDNHHASRIDVGLFENTSMFLNLI